jgi:uncharacterized membrane protein
MSPLIAFGIGIVAGLRSMTAPALVAWAAHLGWLHLQNSFFAFMGSTWAVVILTIFAAAELIADQLPKTPPRTAPVGLIARIITGAFSGACVAVSALTVVWIGAAIGVVGAIIGAYGGYNARTALVRALRVPDFVVAIPEDVIAIALGLFLVSRS